MAEDLPKKDIKQALYDLLDALEDERLWIKGQIEQAPSEDVDFLMAHAHIKASGKINQFVHILSLFRSHSEIDYDRLVLQLERFRNTPIKNFQNSSSSIDQNMVQDIQNRWRQNKIVKLEALLNEFEFSELDFGEDNLVRREVSRLLDGDCNSVQIEFYEKKQRRRRIDLCN